MEAVILRSPTCKVQAADEEAEGGRADEGLEVSEKSAVCLPQEKDPEQNVHRPYFRFAQIHSARGRREKRMEKDESKSTGKSQPTEGTSWGHWCLLECKVSLWYLNSMYCTGCRLRIFIVN